MRDALRATGLKTKREAVELGLQTLVHLNKQAEIRRIRGKMEWRRDLDTMRIDRLVPGRSRRYFTEQQPSCPSRLE